MNRFWDAMKGLGGVLLLGGFLWLGVPRCSEVGALTKAERQERVIVDILCRQIRAKYYFEPNPRAMTPDEWRAAVRAYQSAQAAELETLEKRPEVFENLTDEVVDRLADRLRGR